MITNKNLTKQEKRILIHLTNAWNEFIKLYWRSKMKEECGNCDKWMKKSSCPLEKLGKKPPCSYPGCSEFITKEEYYKQLKNDSQN